MLVPYLHTASIVLGLGHPDVKASLLARSIMLSLCHVAIEGSDLISVVKGQLVKCRLHITSSQLRLGHLVAEAGLLIGCSHCGSHCTGLLVGAVHSELIKGILRNKESPGLGYGSIEEGGNADNKKGYY